MEGRYVSLSDTVRGRDGGVDLTCLGVLVVPVVICVLVILALSWCSFHPLNEIWICLVFFLLFSDDLVLFYWPRVQQIIYTGLSWDRQPTERPCSVWSGKLSWCSVFCISLLHTFTNCLLTFVCLCVVYCTEVCVLTFVCLCVVYCTEVCVSCDLVTSETR